MAWLPLAVVITHPISCVQRGLEVFTMERAEVCPLMDDKAVLGEQGISW
jgi:hypothetical protein